MKQIKDDTNRWRNIPCSWIGRIKIVKMCIPPQAIFRVDAIPIRKPMVFFTDLEQIISRFVWKPKKPRITKAVLIKKNGTGGINLPDFRLYYRATVIMTVCIFFFFLAISCLYFFHLCRTIHLHPDTILREHGVHQLVKFL